MNGPKPIAEVVAEVVTQLEARIDEAAAKGLRPPLSDKHRAEFAILKNRKTADE